MRGGRRNKARTKIFKGKEERTRERGENETVKVKNERKYAIE